MPAPPINVNTEFLFFMERVAISLAIGMMIGLEREWAHKEVGVRTFSIVALASTLSWQISPIASYILMVALIPLVTLVNWRSFVKDRSLETTATVAELASRARSDPARLSVFALLGMLTANSAMLIRNGLILGIFASQALAYGWMSVALMLLASVIATSRIHIKDEETAPLHIQSPISLLHALTFGLLFVLIT